MRVIAEFAVDREPRDIVSGFVHPLEELLRSSRSGRVAGHSVDETIVKARITVQGSEAFDRVLQFLAEAEAPVGTVVYRLSWFGRKRDIFMLDL